MSKEYQAVAKKLDVIYLFWRYGISFVSHLPVGRTKLRPRLIRLDGWIFDPEEIIETIANDPDMSIKYGDKSMNDKQQAQDDLWRGVPLQVALRDAVSSSLTGYKYNELKDHADDDMLDVDEEYAAIDKQVNLLANMFVYYKQLPQSPNHSEGNEG